MTLTPLGDCAVVVTVAAGSDEAVVSRVSEIARALRRDLPTGAVEVVPAFATVTVYYDPAHVHDFAGFCASVERRVARAEAAGPSQPGRLVEIPVCYGGELGPDLGAVAEQAGLTEEETILLHGKGHYVVQAIGFLPGFGYLGGLPERLRTPRRGTPRTSVPAGAVGIGGALTGVYPLASPGGWNLIGRTPLKMFDANRSEPALLGAGDRVRFQRITAEEFSQWK